MEMMGEPEELGALDAAWTSSALPPMNFGRFGCYRCVLSDGCFAALGDVNESNLLLHRRARRW
jgi:hypothetical protein